MKTCVVTKSVRFGRAELLFFPEASPRDLAIGHGFEACFFCYQGPLVLSDDEACSFKHKRKMMDVILSGIEKLNKNGKVERDRSNCGPWSSK